MMVLNTYQESTLDYPLRARRAASGAARRNRWFRVRGVPQPKPIVFVFLFSAMSWLVIFKLVA